MSTRFTFLAGLAAIGCGKAGPPPAPQQPPPAPAATTPPLSGANKCRPFRDLRDQDPAGLGLELCTRPAPKGSDGNYTITIRRARDQHVLWTDVADSIAQAHIVGNQTPPALQIVIVHEVEPTDAEDAEDAYYVIDFELVDGAIDEVGRFRDSGD